ncbi:hypothetical protein [Thermoflexibacter ruber]|nr:hypothetical protein [Thermoflexibacter ruber]
MVKLNYYNLLTIKKITYLSYYALTRKSGDEQVECRRESGRQSAAF